MAGLSNGDEIRLKGLSLSTYMVDAGSDWYVVTQTRIDKASPHEAAVLAELVIQQQVRPSGQAGLIWMHDKTFTDLWSVADSSGVKPPYFLNAYVNDISNPNQNLYSNSVNGQDAMFLGPMRLKGTDAGTATMQLYLLSPNYYLNEQTTGTRYFAQYSNIGLKITDGWTSETSRDGYTLIPIVRNSTSSVTFYFNHRQNLSSGPDTHYDLPRTHFLNNNADNGSYRSNTILVSSATGGYAPHHGKDVVQRLGGTLNAGYNTAISAEVKSYYNTNYSSTSDSACNSFEIGNAQGGNSSFFTNNLNYGSGNETIRVNNSNSYTYPYLGSAGGNFCQFQIGTFLQYSGVSGGGMALTQDGMNVTVLDGAYFYQYTGAGALFVNNANLTFAGNAYNYENGTQLSAAIISPNQTGPVVSSLKTANQPFTAMVNLLATSWQEKAAVFIDGRNYPHFTTSDNCALGILNVGAGDYTTDDCGFLVKTTKIHYQVVGSTGIYPGTTAIHFSSNTQDGRPIGLMSQTTVSGGFSYPLIYYNDQNKSDALCIKCNGLSPSYFRYIMAVEQQMPAYTSGSTVTFTVNVETESTFTSQKRVNVRYVDNTGNLTYVSLLDTYSAITTATNYSASVSGANMYLSSNGTPLRHCRFYIDVLNEPTNRPKMWINNMTVTVT